MRYVVTRQLRVSHVVSTVPPRAGFSSYDAARLARGDVRTMCGEWYDSEGVSGLPVLRICPGCAFVVERRRARVAELEADL